MGGLSRPLSLPLLPLCRLDLTKKLVVILPMLRWGRVVVDQLTRRDKSGSSWMTCSKKSIPFSPALSLSRHRLTWVTYG